MFSCLVCDERQRFCIFWRHRRLVGASLRQQQRAEPKRPFLTLALKYNLTCKNACIFNHTVGSFRALLSCVHLPSPPLPCTSRRPPRFFGAPRPRFAAPAEGHGDAHVGVRNDRPSRRALHGDRGGASPEPGWCMRRLVSSRLAQLLTGALPVLP